ncbi:MAG: right-handed parallel beta-helix repeat-containing protein [Methylomonas sp.]|jgi:parallel beta-helix repeat protein
MLKRLKNATKSLIAVIALILSALIFYVFFSDKILPLVESKAFVFANKLGIVSTHYFESAPAEYAVNSAPPSNNFNYDIAAHIGGCIPESASELVINVKDQGAAGDGAVNDTAAFQNAVDRAAGSGGTVYVPDGVYMIDAIAHINLKDNMTLRLSKGAVLKAMPNNQENYAIISIQNVANVNVQGGVLQGERAQHQGSAGEWGMGLEILGAKHVVVENVAANDNWGDGFYVGNEAGDILFCAVKADNNRRQGMSVTSANGVKIQDSVFTNANGTPPMAGLDLEPNKGETVANVRVLRSQFLHNHGSGILLSVPDAIAGQAFIRNVELKNNRVAENGVTGFYSAGIHLTQQSNQRVIENTVIKNWHDGIAIVSESRGNMISGNQVIGNGNSTDKKTGIGIILYNRSTDNTVTNNIIGENVNHDILDLVGGNWVEKNKRFVGRAGNRNAAKNK